MSNRQEAFGGIRPGNPDIIPVVVEDNAAAPMGRLSPRRVECGGLAGLQRAMSEPAGSDTGATGCQIQKKRAACCRHQGILFNVVAGMTRHFGTI
tara:strand:+ start:669 stop:953 length:285 start_codon:yes stop_codon:yes gene_type:complete